MKKVGPSLYKHPSGSYYERICSGGVDTWRVLAASTLSQAREEVSLRKASRVAARYQGIQSPEQAGKVTVKRVLEQYQADGYPDKRERKRSGDQAYYERHRVTIRHPEIVPGMAGGAVRLDIGDSITQSFQSLGEWGHFEYDLWMSDGYWQSGVATASPSGNWAPWVLGADTVSHSTGGATGLRSRYTPTQYYFHSEVSTLTLTLDAILGHPSTGYILLDNFRWVEDTQPDGFPYAGPAVPEPQTCTFLAGLGLVGFACVRKYFRVQIA